MNLSLNVALDNGTYALAGVLAIAVGALLIMKIVYSLWSFRDHLSHINNEILRTRGREQAYWKRQKKRLWLSLLPFVQYRR